MTDGRAAAQPSGPEGCRSRVIRGMLCGLESWGNDSMRVRALCIVRRMALCMSLAAVSLATFGAVSIARAQTTDVVVGVPIRDGQAGPPQPGVIVDLEGKRQRDALPAPVIIQQLEGPGTTTVTPKFGGGYTVENDKGTTTTVQPKFGGGYSVQNQDGSKTEVTPKFGGGYTVEKQGPTAKPR